MFTKASSTCNPAPVMPPPGDSLGSSRQPPETRVECSLEKCPSICITLPISPLSTTRLSSRIEAKHLLLLPLPRETLAARTAATARSASARVNASGFSHQTGLPAAATMRTCSTCKECGVASMMACTSGSAMASLRSVDNRKPCLAASSRASSGSLVTPCTMRRRLLLPWMELRIVWPQRPRPTMATLIIVTPTPPQTGFDSSVFSDAEAENPFGFRVAFQRVAGLPQQIRNIDRGQRIGAFRHDQVAGFQTGQHLAHPQRRQRAFQAAQVHGLIRHGLSPVRVAVSFALMR